MNCTMLMFVSKIDLRTSYNQVQMTTSDVNKTTFRIHGATTNIWSCHLCLPMLLLLFKVS